MRFLKKVVGTFLALLPIVVIVLFVHFFFYQFETEILIKFLVSVVLASIGEAFLLSGIDSTIMPMGELMVQSINKASKLVIFLFFAVAFGAFATIAEPDVAVFCGQAVMNGVSISKTIFVFLIGAGVGLAIALGVVRIIKNIDIKYFEGLYSYFKDKSQKCLDIAYDGDALVDYKACKGYLIYLSLINKPTSIKYIHNMSCEKIYGELNLSKDTIYQTVNISWKDTIEATDYLWSYHKECDRYCEKVYLKIPLLLSTGELIIRTILGTYCDKCKKYFVLDTEFKKILCEGRIQAQISFSESGEHFNGMDLSPESLLRKCGYTVSANANISAEHRQKLLKAIIENKLYTPAKIVAHFRFLISVNSSVTSRDMSAAISKWEEDILYLIRNYS